MVEFYFTFPCFPFILQTHLFLGTSDKGVSTATSLLFSIVFFHSLECSEFIASVNVIGTLILLEGTGGTTFSKPTVNVVRNHF